VDDDATNQWRMAHAERGRKRTARRHPGDDGPFRVGAIASLHRLDHRCDDCALAGAAHIGGIEPVPASPGVRVLPLSRQQHQAADAVGQLDDPGPLDQLFDGLLAAVAKHEQRCTAPARVAARHVQQVFAARQHEHRAVEKPSPAPFRTLDEMAGRRLAAEQPGEIILEALPVRFHHRHVSW
jgi:hypothetical protein